MMNIQQLVPRLSAAVLLAAAAGSAGDVGATGKFGVIHIKTRAPENRSAAFHYRVPRSYDPKNRESCRILVIFGGRNTDGRNEVGGKLGWDRWADRNNVFLLAPGFKNDAYWEPREWSGRALFQAVAQLKKQYNVCPGKLLFYGYSAGSQASNLFPGWRPDRCRAWVSHACGVFHEPGTRMRVASGLVTCGDADKARYLISRNFVEAARRKGVNVIWKSFPNHPHDVPPGSLALARTFLEYYHTRHREDLTGSGGKSPESDPVAWVGDDQEQEFYAADSPRARNVFPEDRVLFPCRELADAWGRPARNP